MNREELNELIKELVLLLERPKWPGEATIQVWLNDLTFIPSNCLAFVKQQMRALETWPRNFPNFIKAKYMEWREGRKQQIRECPGECRQGFWEVARYRTELQEWAIYRFPCICVKAGGFSERNQLLKDHLYQREPDRFQQVEPSWALIYPDLDGIRVMKERILAHLKKVREARGGSAGPLEPLDDLFF